MIDRTGIPDGYPMACSDEVLEETIAWVSSRLKGITDFNTAVRWSPYLHAGLIERQIRLTRQQIEAMRLVTAALENQTASADALGKRLLGYTVAICILTALLCVLTGLLAWPELVKLWKVIFIKYRSQ
jgi:hypothetical protein